MEKCPSLDSEVHENSVLQGAREAGKINNCLFIYFFFNLQIPHTFNPTCMYMFIFVYVSALCLHMCTCISY